MYIPQQFKQTDLTKLDDLIRFNPFVTVITPNAENPNHLPNITQLPIHYVRNENNIEIIGHYAKPNPQATYSGAALLLISGPDAYISPSWYPDKITQSRVPTWNYTAAQLTGNIQLTTDTDDLIDIISKLSAFYENKVGGLWQFNPDDPNELIQLKGIVGFHFKIETIDIKYKLNQHHPNETMQGAINELSQQSDNKSQLIAQLMQTALNEKISSLN